MFCKKCGTQIADESTYCTNCGTALFESTSANSDKKRISNKTIGFIACGVIAIVAIISTITLINVIGKDTPEEVAKKYAVAQITGDYQALLSYSPGEADFNSFLDSLTIGYLYSSEYLYKKYGTTDFSEIYEISRAKALEEFESRYGSDYKLEVTTTKIREYTENEYAEIIQEYNDELEASLYFVDDSQNSMTNTITQMMINPNDVKSVCKIEAKAVISGNLGSDTSTTDIYCVKIGNDWKVIECLDYYPFEFFKKITNTIY